MRSLRHRFPVCLLSLVVLHAALWCQAMSLAAQAIPSRAALGASADTLGVIRAIHIGGNFGRNPIGIAEQPQDYYDFLRDLKVNWVGIVVGLQVMSSIDSTLERAYNIPLPTFEDNMLIDAIRGFKGRGYKVYICLAIETQTAAQSQYPVHGHQLGDPYAPSTDSAIKPEYWPWDPAHANYQQFVDSFWRSYTNEAVYFARIAQQEGADLFAIGAERDRLFRTRSGGVGPNNFRNQIQVMVDSVRSVYSGLVTYELHWSALADPGYFGPGSDHLWEDVGLDVVGVSGYFKLADPAPTSVMSVAQLEASWENIFSNFLTPLQNRNPQLPVVFLEFGYVDVIESPFFADWDSFKPRAFKDKDGNGLDDGEETQANAYEAFFNVNERHNNLVRGAFLFGNDITSQSDWEQTFGEMRTLAIRNKLAESVVKTHYTSYVPVPGVPLLLSPPNGSQQVSVPPVLQWQGDLDADTYRVQVSDESGFTTVLVDTSGITGTSCVIQGLQPEKTQYWRVQASNATGTSSYSDVWNFTTALAIPAAPSLSSPANGATGVSLQPTLSWTASTGAVTYHLQVSTQSDFSSLVVDDSLLTTTSRQIGPLAEGASYRWRVRAKNSAGTSPYSSVSKFMTMATAPAAPVLLTPAHGATEVTLQPTLTWSASPGAEAYRLQVSTQSNFSTHLVDDSLLTTTSRQIGPLGKSMMHHWRVRAKNAGGESPWSSTFSFTTEVPSAVGDEEDLVIKEYQLFQNYPNPFNPVTIIGYQIPQSGHVRLTVYDALGVEVAVLVNQEQHVGFYRIEFDGIQLPTGVYFARLHAGSFTAIRKLMLLR